MGQTGPACEPWSAAATHGGQGAQPEDGDGPRGGHGLTGDLADGEVRAGFGGDTEIIGYDAWVRVEGCSGHVLVRFDRWGDHRTTGDLTRCG